MTGKTGDGDHRQKYILTMGWPEKIRRLRALGIKLPGIESGIFIDTKKEIVHLFSECFGEDRLLVFDTREMAEEIVSRAVTTQDILKDATIVSTCPEVSSLINSYKLEVNRITDVNTSEIIGIGPRPGHSSMRNQILSLANHIGRKKVVIVEDGAFTGMTLTSVIQGMKDSRIDIAAIVVGFVFPQALAAIKEVFDGELIIVEKPGAYIDWIPDYDMMPFTPNCGRVLGLSMRGTPAPLYSNDGMSFSIPYIDSFCPAEEWTSIPKEERAKISLFCAQRSLELFRHIEKINGSDLSVGDICASKQVRIGAPTSVSQTSFPGPNYRVTEFLSETCHMLS